MSLSAWIKLSSKEWDTSKTIERLLLLNSQWGETVLSVLTSSLTIFSRVIKPSKIWSKKSSQNSLNFHLPTWRCSLTMSSRLHQGYLNLQLFLMGNRLYSNVWKMAKMMVEETLNLLRKKLIRWLLRKSHRRNYSQSNLSTSWWTSTWLLGAERVLNSTKNLPTRKQQLFTRQKPLESCLSTNGNKAKEFCRWQPSLTLLFGSLISFSLSQLFTIWTVGGTITTLSILCIWPFSFKLSLWLCQNSSKYTPKTV